MVPDGVAEDGQHHEAEQRQEQDQERRDHVEVGDAVLRRMKADPANMNTKAATTSHPVRSGAAGGMAGVVGGHHHFSRLKASTSRVSR